jgi:hypothetical protein
MTTQNPKAQQQKQQNVEPPAPAADAAPQQQKQQGGNQAAQAQPQAQSNSGKRIIVRNLPPGITREELRELGDRYGRVVNVELVAKPQKGPPFGFISFLTEDDAGFSIYRLHEHHYRGYVLDASLSIPKQREAPNKNSKGATTGGNRQKDEKPKKTKKPMYSLRTLTPLNPPSAPPQTAQGNPQAKGWDNAAPAQVSPSVSNNSQPSGDNGYVQNQSGKGNNNNNSGKQGRKQNNNNNNNRSRGKQNFKAVPEPVDDVPTEAVPEHSYDANIEMIHTTEVHITIEESQIWWTLKLAPDQLQDFYKALEPFGCYPNNH